MGNPRIWNRQMVMDCKILDKSKMCVFVESFPNREQQGIEDTFTQKDHPNGGKPHFNDMRSVVRRRAHFRPIRHASLEHIFEVRCAAVPRCICLRRQGEGNGDHPSCDLARMRSAAPLETEREGCLSNHNSSVVWSLARLPQNDRYARATGRGRLLHGCEMAHFGTRLWRGVQTAL